MYYYVLWPACSLQLQLQYLLLEKCCYLPTTTYYYYFCSQTKCLILWISDAIIDQSKLNDRHVSVFSP